MSIFTAVLFSKRSFEGRAEPIPFIFKSSVEWKLVKATGTAQRNKANDWSETFLLPFLLKNYTIADVVLFFKESKSLIPEATNCPTGSLTDVVPVRTTTTVPQGAVPSSSCKVL